MFFVISGPPNLGKSYIINKILEFYSNYVPFTVPISHTTRPARAGEIWGKNYYFVGLAEFLHLIAQGCLWEYKQLGNYHYGTSKSELERIIASGKHAILSLDVFAGLKLKEHYPDKTKLIYLSTNYMPLLERRFLERANLDRGGVPDTDADIKLRRDLEELSTQIYMGKRYYQHLVEHTSQRATVAEICNHIITPALTRVIEEYDPEFNDAFPIPMYPKF